MDVYLKIDYSKCQKCGLCIEACEYGALGGGKNHTPTSYCDPMPCRGCSEPCKEACYYNAIDWERW